MNVAGLIELLKQDPQDLPVCYRLYSEWCMLEAEDISVEQLCEARSDGWVHDARPDKTTIPYLTFPGN